MNHRSHNLTAITAMASVISSTITQPVRHILRHPMYAGAYRYGFRPTDARRQVPGHPRGGRGSGLAAEDCLVFLKDRFPAYISWERFEANQARLTANRARIESAGAVRDGSAVLAGVVWCGRCGRRMDRTAF